MGTQLGRVIERERAAEQLQHQQEALRQREKLATMGSLLASVAHELNNPLAVIALQADLLREETSGSAAAEHIEEISQAATRCERLVRNFLTLSRQHPPERVAVDLNALITNTLELLEPAFRVDTVPWTCAWTLISHPYRPMGSNPASARESHHQCLPGPA